MQLFSQAEGFYDCEDIPVFELGSCHYDTYLLNLQLPATKGLNDGIGKITGVNFVVSSIFPFYSN